MERCIMVHKAFASFIGLYDREGLLEGSDLNKIVFRKENAHGNALTLDG